MSHTQDHEATLPLCRAQEPTYDIYMDTVLSRLLYISYRNLLVIDSEGAKSMNTFANQWLSLLKL